MANQEHLDVLKQGSDAWGKWRKDNLSIKPDLSRADLSGADFIGIDLSKVNLSRANLNRVNFRGTDLSSANLIVANRNMADHYVSMFGARDLILASLSKVDLRIIDLNGANLSEADLTEADLSGADFVGADLSRAKLSKANLIGAYLNGANLSEADLTEADLFGADLYGANLSKSILSGANLSGANLSRADLSRADLTGCSIYAISAWDVQLEETIQSNLIITSPYNSDEPLITVDSLEVAQFIYLLLRNKKIRDVIDTITSKVVLILGRFTKERKVVLDAIRDELHRHNYAPVLFDFEKPASRDLTETVSTLAHLARFIIADLTNPNSIPHEVATIIPQCKVPIQPLLVQGDSIREYPMVRDFRLYPWVLPTFRYQDTPSLLASLSEHVIEPAERKVKELAKLKTEE